jgi:hypothetical protein
MEHQKLWIRWRRITLQQVTVFGKLPDTFPIPESSRPNTYKQQQQQPIRISKMPPANLDLNCTPPEEEEEHDEHDDDGDFIMTCKFSFLLKLCLVMKLQM